MRLNVEDWKEFTVGKLFSIDRGKESAPNQNEDGNCSLINETSDNNGFTRKVKPTKVFNGNAITVSINFGTTVFYQPYDFCASVNIAILRNEEMTEKSGVFLVAILKAENSKYGYGYKTSNDRLENTVLNLPICRDENNEPIIDPTHKYSEEGYIPDFEWMENYIKTLKHKPLTTSNVGKTTLQLNVSRWKEFEVGKLFQKIYKAQAYIKNDVIVFELPALKTIRFITRTDINNGCDCYIENKDLLGIEEGNAIIIGDTTSTCFYQNDVFVAGDHIVVCRAHWLDKYTGLFIKTLLEKERYKYSYGRAFKMDLIKDTTIELPICFEEDGETPVLDTTHKYSKNGYIPDFKFMEGYIKSLPYGDRLM